MPMFEAAQTVHHIWEAVILVLTVERGAANQVIAVEDFTLRVARWVTQEDARSSPVSQFPSLGLRGTNPVPNCLESGGSSNQDAR